MEGKSIKESDRYTWCVRFCCAILSVFLIIIGIILLGDDDDDLEENGKYLLIIGVAAGIQSCLPYKGDIEILDKKIGPCSKCNTLNSLLEIYRRVTKREHRFSCFIIAIGRTTITHWSEPRVHCMKCGCDMTVIEYRQENETAATASENEISGSEEEASVESCALSSSFEHGAKDKSKSLFSDLANAIDKEDREKKRKEAACITLRDSLRL